VSTIAHVNNVLAPNSQQQNAGSDDGVSNNSTEFATYPKKINLTDIDATIEEVEEILAANPELPQLSRSEILHILDNITSAIPERESISASVSHTGHYKSHEEYLRAMRALMLVLPYNAKNLSESKIQELYTKAPIIQLIEDNSEAITTVKTKTKPSPAFTLLTSTTVEPQQTKYSNHEIYHQRHDSQPIHSDSHHNYESETKAPQTTTLTMNQNSSTKRSNHRRRRPMTTTTSQAPGSYDYQFLNEHYETTKLSSGEQTVTTVYPQKTGDYNTADRNYQSSKTVTVQEIVSTVYPERTNFQEGIISPNYISENYNVQLQSPLQNKTQHYNGLQPNPSQQRTKPISTANGNEPHTSVEVTGIRFDLPSDMKNLLMSFGVDDQLSNHPVHNTSKKIMPLSTSEKAGSFLELPKYSSQYSASELVFETTTTQKPVMRDDVKEILESIGLFPNKERQDGVTETPSTTTTTTTATPDVAAAAESLSSEMKDLLISFGLLPSANDIQQGSDSVNAEYVESPVVDPISYLSFKPLPLSTNHNKEDKEDKQMMSSDMKEFLASFGLVPTSDSDEGYSGKGSFSEHGSFRRFRSQKAVKMDANNSSNITTNKPDLNSNATMSYINTDMLTDEMKDILENLGFLPFPNLTVRKTNPGEGHIFNPSSHLASLHPTKEEVQRLKKLLDTIKKLMKENGTITQDEIDALNASISIILPPATVKHDNKTTHSARDLANILPVLFAQENKSVPLDHMKDAPDPLSLEELVLLTDDDKNEVKRQQSSNETTTEATNQDKGPSLTDLADSFGGSAETTPGEVSVNDALPTKKPNGLYFLLDWNTFLDVGEEGNSRRVNLRFNPRLGNRRDFLPVTVP
jgi:hypothetical protein